MSFDETLRALVVAIVREELARQLAEQRTEYLPTDEAAALAKVAPGTIRRWVADGKLTEHRAGRHVRVRRADLEQLLRRGVRGPRADQSMTPEALAKRTFAARMAKR